MGCAGREALPGMTIHPFPKSLRGSPRQRSWPCSSEFDSSPQLAGAVPACIEKTRTGSGSFFSCFQRPDHTQQDQRHVPILVTEFRVGRPQCGDLLTRAEQIRLAAILADDASADLLARAVQFQNSLTVHGSKKTTDRMEDVENSLRESPEHAFA